MVATAVTNHRVSEQNIEPLVVELTNKFSDATGLKPRATPRVEFGGCCGADALLMHPSVIRVNESLVNDPLLFEKVVANSVAQSILYQSGLGSQIWEYLNSFKDSGGAGFDNALIAVNRSPSRLVIGGIAEAPAHQFEALYSRKYLGDNNCFGTEMYALRLNTMRSVNIVSAMANELTDMLRRNDLLDVKGLMGEGWQDTLYKDFCSEARANNADPDDMSIDYKTAYYGKIFALADAMRFDYDPKKALDYEVKRLQEFAKRLSTYVNDPDTWLGWLRGE